MAWAHLFHSLLMRMHSIPPHNGSLESRLEVHHWIISRGVKQLLSACTFAQMQNLRMHLTLTLQFPLDMA
jgi:hypothetical protein